MFDKHALDQQQVYNMARLHLVIGIHLKKGMEVYGARPR